MEATPAAPVLAGVTGSGDIVRCNVCLGFGHAASICTSAAAEAVLAIETPLSEEDVAVDAEAFMANKEPPGECTTVNQVGDGELARQVESLVADSAVSCHMSNNADQMDNYQECDRSLNVASGDTIPIAGYGDLTVTFRSGNKWINLKLVRVAHIPQLDYHLVSLPTMGAEGQTYVGDGKGIKLNLNCGKSIWFPLCGKLHRQYRFRPK